MDSRDILFPFILLVNSLRSGSQLYHIEPYQFSWQKVPYLHCESYIANHHENLVLISSLIYREFEIWKGNVKDSTVIVMSSLLWSKPAKSLNHNSSKILHPTFGSCVPVYSPETWLFRISGMHDYEVWCTNIHVCRSEFYPEIPVYEFCVYRTFCLWICVKLKWISNFSKIVACDCHRVCQY